jgi:predicted phosphodiesterase
VLRFALFSDVHGNLPALDAVLTDIGAAGVDEVYCLGDLVGYGPDPAGVVSRIRGLGIPTLRGNYDDGVGNRRGGCGCYYANDEAREDGAASYAFTDAALDDADHSWLASLPDEFRFEIDGARVLLAHGSPRKINEYLMPDRTDAQLLRLALEAQADVVCVGHVHVPYHRVIESAEGRGIHYVSSGSAGKPKDGDPRACWVEVIIGPETDVRTAAEGDAAGARAGCGDVWLGTIVHRVAYDVARVANAMRDVGLPERLALALQRA